MKGIFLGLCSLFIFSIYVSLSLSEILSLSLSLSLSLPPPMPCIKDSMTLCQKKNMGGASEFPLISTYSTCTHQVCEWVGGILLHQNLRIRFLKVVLTKLLSIWTHFHRCQELCDNVYKTYTIMLQYCILWLLLCSSSGAWQVLPTVE